MHMDIMPPTVHLTLAWASRVRSQGPTWRFSSLLVEPGDGAELVALAQVDDLIAGLDALGGESRVQRGHHLLGLPIAACGAISYQCDEREDSDEYQTHNQNHMLGPPFRLS